MVSILLLRRDIRPSSAGAWRYRSILANIAIFDANALAILPLCHFGAERTAGCWNNNPCLGGLAPVFSALNRAFSAPRICIVLAGRNASFLRLPALAISLAAITGVSIFLILGAISSITVSIISDKASLSLDNSITSDASF